MTLHELSAALQTMYASAPKGRQVTMVHLFGIQYAPEIRASGFAPREIVRAAGLSETYVTEVNKGIRLAPYVRVREDALKEEHYV